ncbi:hypothetical protein J132_04177 [Termitomyces sp. J132]|nr:hypothetical protein J132_04177 [Termitomyces sp. J132]
MNVYGSTPIAGDTHDGFHPIFHASPGSLENPNFLINPDNVEATNPHGKPNILGNPGSIEDPNFPPLPSIAANSVDRTAKTRPGHLRLTFGRQPLRKSEKSKRTLPPSLVKERTLKTHTPMSATPLGTPDHLSVSPTINDNPSQSPSLNASTLKHMPMISFARNMGNINSEVPNVGGMINDAVRNNMELDNDIPDQSNTAVENSAWDNILIDSPVISPTLLNQCIGTSPPTMSWPAPIKPFTKKFTRNGASTQGSLNRSSEPRGGIHCNVKTENDITTNSAGLQRTAVPNGGWPSIHLGSHPLDNVVSLQVGTWKKVASTKLWARLFRGKYEPNSLATVDKTRALIKGLVRVESDIALGVLFPLQECMMESERFPSPYHMLVSGLSNEQAHHLLGLEVVSTKDITIIFKSFKDSRPSFVLTIYGLTFMNSEEAHSVVTDLVINCIQDSEQVMKHIVDCSTGDADFVASNIFNNISVKFIDMKRSNANGGNFRGWNVFLHHSYLSDDDHVKLIQLMRTCTFPSATSGFGLPLLGNKTLQCISCKSINHDTPNCPFPDLPGWLGYKPVPIQPNNAPSNAYNKDTGWGQDNANSNMGMGRGRGGGGHGSRPYGRRAFRGHWN